MAWIGIFDSGVGGLGIFKEIKKLLPKENIIYLADSKNCPYGEKSSQQIKQICLENSKFLINRGAKIVVIACNTGSTIALQFVRSQLNQSPPRRWTLTIPVVGVVPVVKTAAKITKNKKIGILATKRTVESSYLRDLVERFCPANQGYKIYYQAANPLVEFVENFQFPISNFQINSKFEIPKSKIISNWELEIRNYQLLHKYLKKFLNVKVDIVALGCTHFPFLRQQIEQILGPNVKVLDSNAAVARQVKRVLINNNQLEHHKNPQYKFFTSTKPEKTKELIQKLIGLKIKKVAKISL